MNVNKNRNLKLHQNQNQDQAAPMLVRIIDDDASLAGVIEYVMERQ